MDVKPDNTIAWSIQPHKKSINFGLFKHPGPQASLLPQSLSVPSSGGSIPGSSDVDGPSTAIEKLTAIGLKLVVWHGKCEADKITQGTHEIGGDTGGNYALVFDNTFSKQISKTATLALLLYPTQHPPQFGGHIHHSQIGNSRASSVSLRNDGKVANVQQTLSEDQALSQASRPARPRARTNPLERTRKPSVELPQSVHVGILYKRRRKKHQGHARRFFSLDFTSSTLSYYHDKNSSALRGAMPVSLAVLGANAKTQELSIDSGAEIWHLRASNQADFVQWKRALEKASRIASAPKIGQPDLSLNTKVSSADPSLNAETLDWEKIQSVVARVAGTRDALRRLCNDAQGSFQMAQLSQPPSGGSSPLETSGDDWSKLEIKRPFWKRSVSGSSSSHHNRFKRNNTQSQLTVPLPTLPAPSSKPWGAMADALHGRISQTYEIESTMLDHCQALLRDLDKTVTEFSALVVENRGWRAADPKSARSRLSVNSVDSQEFFDASDEGTAAFFEIPDASDDDEAEPRLGLPDSGATDEDSDKSSDLGNSDEIVPACRGFRSDSAASIFPEKAKSLDPLPLPSVSRRANVGAATVMPPSLVGFFRKNVGKDLSTISMPVSANEPISLLQRAAEQMEYSSLLDTAASSTENLERLIFVTAFAITSLSGTRVKERAIRKPFNPMLGETFELVREDGGFRFLSEKVSHRPVQLALCAQASAWSFAQSPLPSQKFWGKSAEIVTDGKVRVILHDHNECFSWSSATSFLRNIIAGEKYVEPVGSMVVVDESTGNKAIVTFKAKGMFSGRSEEVSVTTMDPHGAILPLGLQGNWTEQLCLTEKAKPKDRGGVIWSAGPLVNQPTKHYGMTSFAATLNEIHPAIEKDKLPPTDSRLRPDQRALEEGDHDLAEDLKARLEEKQRTRRKEMEAKGEEWKPRWFTRTTIGGGDEVEWKMKTGKDGYWEERAKRTWTGVVPVTQI